MGVNRGREPWGMVAETEGGEERDKGSKMCQGACRLAVQPGLTANYTGD